MSSRADVSTATTVTFGNPSPQTQVKQEDGSQIGVPTPNLNQSVTEIVMWDGFDDPDFVDSALSTSNDRVLNAFANQLSDTDKHYAVGVAEVDQIVGVHTGGGAPTWVASSDEAFQAVLAAHFNCAQGDPSMLLTNAGRDALHAQHMSTGAQPAAFNYMALTQSTTTPAAGDTTLAGEITTAGLARAQCTYAHTAGTNTTTLTKTFTAQSADVSGGAVTIAQLGVFNSSAGVTLGYHTALSATATLTAVGDNVTITWTETAG